MNDDISAPNSAPSSQVTPNTNSPQNQPSVTPLPTAPPPKKGGFLKTFLLCCLIAILAGAAAGYFAYSYGKTKAPEKVVTKTTTVADIPLTVPKDATVISQCSAGKGALYALPKDIPTGPVYLVNKNKVIGIEFMVGKDDLLVAGKNFLDLSLFKQKYDHVNIGLLSQGHAGFPTPHYHVDVFMVPDAQAKAITCPTT